MKLLKRYLILFFTLTSTVCVSAEEGIAIFGRVYDESGAMLIGANVQLLNASDSTVLITQKAESTYHNGTTGETKQTSGYEFNVPDMSKDYIVKYSNEGFKTKYFDATSEILNDGRMFLNLDVKLEEE